MKRPRIVPATPESIAEAAGLIRAGRPVAFPTETVYGLGGDATRDSAVAAIFAAKDRPRFNPLIVHLPTKEAAESLVAFDDRARRLAETFWPGPLTLVLPRRTDCPVSLLAGAGLDTLAVRVPAHPVALELLQAAGLPLAAPSANRSEEVSPTTAAHVAESLGDRIELILDGGSCRIGLESTVLDLTGVRPVLLRPGGVTSEAIAALVGPVATAGRDDVPRSPGMSRRHYAPRLPLRINACCAGEGEALLAFGPAPADAILNLSPSGDLTEAAANLFAMLRRLDGGAFVGIAVRPIPDHGLGLAINDRLRRASAGRE
ncbi:MAG: L-threonylcarbamoyladenylate synthase [Magnetospirillum sp. WYHS-4]